ncbi:arsenate reductase (glutaredoxin) [Flavobacterium sp. F-380]|uniref:Arsenate reductase (Glutaredoxin) n=1 Tax=Flavobacterium kayseriense TaxID=2764714 RepID=A0ABR7J959_9FLAO|nr:arsenate reductase (glutaredoxin) [Flavobacterium kayseriense]MBC5842081.1 arsenate reductase (glutaredoxin) [Flavobacterium kayseriense]MBC5848611.1 arsenate reductase (glutaredoxin) [Flavobacterium kayseriense]MBU0941286.1 arsenate reductase (glutaredoxin) [Bacteroidota bacterium]
MTPIQIYHNPRCGKSRNCLTFLETNAVEYEIVKYLETPPSYEELSLLLQKLALAPLDLVRKKEKIWIDNYKNRSLTDQEVINAMISNPILIERPIVIKGDKAIIGRDLSQVSEFLK